MLAEAYARPVCSLVIASIRTRHSFARAELGVTAPHANNPSINSIAFVFNPAQNRKLSSGVKFEKLASA